MPAPKPKIKKLCVNCNSLMVLYPYQQHTRKYCSRSCWNQAFGRLMKGNKSRLGLSPWNKGMVGVPTGRKGPRPHVVPHNKIGDGITPHDKLERKRFQRTVQKQAFDRDDYTCQICFKRGGSLQVDHIESWAKHPELRFDINNCRTLCMACHYYVTFKRKLPQGVVWGHNLSQRIQ